MMSLFFEDLPAPWQTVCAKGHADSEDHNRRCYNWISPNVRSVIDLINNVIFFQLKLFAREENTKTGARFRDTFSY